jgi:hypothetical protein
MWYLMYQNDQAHYVQEDSDHIVRVIDHTTQKETLHVTFTPQSNGRLLMETKYPLTHIYAGKEMSASVGAYYSFSPNREVVLLSDSVETPRITVRVVKLDDPKDWPAPSVDVGRAPTLPYDGGVVATPLPVDPSTPPLPAQEQKNSKKRRREFHMC